MFFLVLICVVRTSWREFIIVFEPGAGLLILVKRLRVKHVIVAKLCITISEMYGNINVFRK